MLKLTLFFEDCIIDQKNIIRMQNNYLRLKAGYNFSIDNVKKFLHKQMLWQKYSPKYIPCASYNRITIPNFAHQADLLYLYHDTEGRSINTVCVYVILLI